ncbi:bifunctional DNA primase/polymerase [Streptomyces sp. NBC_01727]|uniref:bifunctional DNA primase/polymerase n=1 Tax=Streptomyces sp. NBC_01727 TaxID=2975924 RepID=UPI002E165128|nr:bifunctional DNA primase/polymerase [Streptomyces sp. NBC_01727]
MTHEARSALLSAALDAAARGWTVFPLRPGSKPPALHGEASCPGSGDCTTRHRKWEQRATTDPDRIRRAWSADRFNIGIATGPSGLIVVDLDLPKPNSNADTPSGVTTFKALYERTGQAVPSTYRVRTASGGYHLYFTAPTGIRLANSAGKLGPLVDTRAWGGYVVGAGSIVHGGTYDIVDPAPVAPLPEWLLNALKPAARPAQPLRLAIPRHGSRAADAVLTRETAAIKAAEEGRREAQLFQSARSLGRFVAWGDIPRHVVEEAFQSAGESTGLPASQCRSTLRSALNWSIRTCRPRQTT